MNNRDYKNKVVKDILTTQVLYVSFGLLLVYGGINVLDKPLTFLALVTIFAYTDLRSYERGLNDRY